MDWGSPAFVLAIIGMSFLAWIVTSWIRAKHGYPIENEWGGLTHPRDPEKERQVELLTAENKALKDQLADGAAPGGAGADRHRSRRAHRARNRKSALNGATGRK